MSETSSFVLSDVDLLQKICGANDENLKHLEGLFGAPVRVRGNSLFLESQNQSELTTFARIVGELEHQTRRGQQPTAELMTTLHRELSVGTAEGLDSLRTVHITIPIAGTKVFPRSVRQAAFLRALDAAQLNFCVGPAGTGKTFLAIAHALREVLSKRKRKLILSRPVVEAGESLGYLPGDLAQKISPYLRPLYDAMEALIPFDVLRRMEEQNIIEVAPLAYMRGRSLRDCYVILDEAQNSTREQMKMFLTRLGENSQAVVTGDVTQIDLPRRSASGMVHALHVLSGIDEIIITRLHREDIVRSPLVRQIIKAYDEYRE